MVIAVNRDAQFRSGSDSANMKKHSMSDSLSHAQIVVFYIPAVILTSVFLFARDSRYFCCSCLRTQRSVYYCCRGKSCWELEYHYLDINPDRNDIKFETFSVKNDV